MGIGEAECPWWLLLMSQRVAGCSQLQLAYSDVSAVGESGWGLVQCVSGGEWCVRCSPVILLSLLEGFQQACCTHIMSRLTPGTSAMRLMLGADAAEHSRGQGCPPGVVFQGADCAAGACGMSRQRPHVWMLCDLAGQCMAGSADSSSSMLLAVSR